MSLFKHFEGLSEAAGILFMVADMQGDDCEGFFKKFGGFTSGETNVPAEVIVSKTQRRGMVLLTESE